MNDDSDDEMEDLSDEDGLLAFLMEDAPIIESLVSSVRSLLQRPELDPQTISEIGIFLFGLERLPAPTPGISMSLTLQFELNRERDWLCLNIEDDRFVLDKGFSTYQEGIGSDHYTEIILEVGEGYREGDTFEAMQYAETFAELATDPSRTISITANADDPFNDWDLESDPDAWGKLDSDYL
jgi:hypothetical protein